MHSTAIDQWYGYLGVPVLVGMESTDGFQVAVYVNPDAKRTETKSHLYFKHSSAEQLAFQRDGYQGAGDPMFDPIRLKNRRIGVQICHDMFFGLVGQQFLSRGADLHIDITGGDVRRKKWLDVVAGRSIELRAPFLCTMSKRSNRGGHAFALAMDRGHQLQPVISQVNDHGFSGFVVFNIDVSDTPGQPEEVEQAFSPERYQDILISSGPIESSSPHHLHLIPGRGGLAQFKRTGEPEKAWRGFNTATGRVGVLPLSVSKLADGLAIHRHESQLRARAFTHHVVAFVGEPPDWNEALALMKLRAIEHRMAIIVVGRTKSECIKTNNYRAIQRIEQHSGVFGLNKDCLGGTTRALNGIHPKHHSAYFDLMP